MKNLLVILLFIIPTFCIGQTSNLLLTSKYGGVYRWKSKVTEDRGGVVYVYPESDTAILFFLGLNGGAPSYNSGELYGRINISNDTGVFFNSSYPGADCKFRFTFIGGNLNVKTMEDKYDCGFGAGIGADGEFKRESTIIPEYFEGNDGRVYFKTTKPQQFYK